MLKATQAQYDALKGTAAETAARRNLAYFAVAASLLDPNAPIPDPVKSEVNAGAQADSGSTVAWPNRL